MKPRKVGVKRNRNQADSPKAYAAAGVDIDLGNALKGGIQRIAASTHGPRVLGKIGGFGGFFKASFPGIKEPVLVASIDGVGTKLKLAFQAPPENRAHAGVARDLVNHCVNDIAVTGAAPLFFLDYIGAEHLDPRVFKELLSGFAAACKAAGCALLGGETAQMPGMYAPGEYDLAGCIVGIVDRRRILDGSGIRPGDAILGIPSAGLHTNGFSLARRALFEIGGLSLDAAAPGTNRTLLQELLRPHRSYLKELQAVAPLLKGAVHVTGGGLVDNFPRILPDGTDALIRADTWKAPPIFDLIREVGSVPKDEMFQVFNMGIGMALVVSKKDVPSAKALTKAKLIGEIVSGNRRVRIG